jgi:hypothetical protein
MVHFLVAWLERNVQFDILFFVGFHGVFHQYGGNVRYPGVHVCTDDGHVLFGQSLRVDTVRNHTFDLNDAG